VYEVDDNKDNHIPIFQWHGSMSKKGETHLHNVAMFTLSGTILLMCMGACDLMRYANILEKGIKFLILPTPVGLNNNDIMIKHVLNKFLKLKEIFRNLIFMME
jgi:biotin transporter BioY